MRNAFADEVTKLAGTHKDLFLLSGDIGNRLFDSFKEKHNDRFLNCGVAEQNMMGVAAGMAMTGLRPVVYTINSFLTTRCYEQIRLDVCYHNAPVVIVGVGGGIGYASLGATHHSLEDVATLRVLPNLKVLVPADPVETRLALRTALQEKGPVYIRLGKKGEPVLHATEPDFRFGKGLILKEGRDICFIAAGAILPIVLAAGAEIDKTGMSCRVISFPSIKPMDQGLLAECFEKFKYVVVAEDHARMGGLGGAIAEWRADHPEARAQLLRFGTGDEYLHGALTTSAARRSYGLTAEQMTEQILKIARNKK